MPQVIKRIFEANSAALVRGALNIWTIYDLTTEPAQTATGNPRSLPDVWAVLHHAWRARRSQDRGGVAVMGVYIRGALIAWSIWWLFYAIGSSRTEAEIPRLDAPAFNDRFSDWVAVEPPKAKMVETEVISVKPIELTPVTYIKKPEPEVRSSCKRVWFTVDRHRYWKCRK